MFARFLRSAAYAAFTALVAAAMNVVLDPMLAAMGADAKGTMLYEGLTAAGENFLLIGIFALLFGLLYGSVVESRVGGV